MAGGTFGVVGTLCFLVAFSTDYWLVAVEDCNSDEPTKPHPTRGKDANRTKVGHRLSATPSSRSLSQKKDMARFHGEGLHDDHKKTTMEASQMFCKQWRARHVC